jgi:hypothetical protein
LFAAALVSLKARLSSTLSTAVWGAAAGLAALVALGFFVGAVFVWLSDRYNSLTACVVLGLVFATLSVLALVVAAIRRRRAARVSAEQMMAAVSEMAALGANFGQTLKGRQGKYYLLAALAAGWLIGKTLSRR